LSSQYSAAPEGLPIAERALNAVLGRMQLIQLTSEVLGQARTLVRRHRLGIGLRTLDALHIASALEVQAELGAGAIEYITADRRQHQAFAAEGLAGALL
jgi:predicted nucleic acid-binding protein